jgi:hypothetical protein
MKNSNLHKRNLLPQSSESEDEGSSSFETSLTIYQTTWNHISEVTGMRISEFTEFLGELTTTQGTSSSQNTVVSTDVSVSLHVSAKRCLPHYYHFVSLPLTTRN